MSNETQALGFDAHEAGDKRILPTELASLSVKDRQDWYRGWDEANAADHYDGPDMNHNLLKGA